MSKVFSDLSGKTVLITGASSGLGESIAYEVSRKGARVILCSRREEELLACLKKCESISNQKGAFYPMDISNYDEVELVLEKIKSDFEEIDVLVNCAGMGLFQPF